VATKRERLASRGPLRGFVGTVTNELLLERGIPAPVLVRSRA